MRLDRKLCLSRAWLVLFTLCLTGCDFGASAQLDDFRPLAAAALAVHSIDESPFIRTSIPAPGSKPTSGLNPSKQETANTKQSSCKTSCPCTANGKCICSNKPPAPLPAASRRTGMPAGISPAPAVRSSAPNSPNACGPNGCAVNGGVRVVPQVFGRFR